MNKSQECNHLIILGSTSSLGAAFVRNFSAGGFSSCLGVSRTPREENSVASFNHLACDLLTETGLSRFDERLAHIPAGRLCVVSCLGYYKGSEPFLSTTLAEAQRILEANYISCYRAVFVALQHMVRRNQGHIITFSCHSVHYAYPMMVPFSAAKAALEGLTRGIANEFSRFNIQANSIRLATLRNEHERSVKPFGDFQHWLKPDEIACEAMRIAQSGSVYINGAIIPMFEYSDSFYNESFFHRTKRK